MGFLDVLKRWRLAQQGLSSGKKRRIHSESPMIQVLESSSWIKLGIYAMFVAVCGTLAISAAPGSSFDSHTLQGATFAVVISIMAVVIMHRTLRPPCTRNSRILLVCGGLVLQLTLVRAATQMIVAGAIPQHYLFFIIPYALAPMFLGVLLGRAVGFFSAVFVTIVGCLFIPHGEAPSYMLLSMVAGLISVLLAHNVRKRQQLLKSGACVGALTVALSLMLGRLNVGSVFGPDSFNHLQILGAGGLTAFGIGLLTALLISGLLPIFEGAFHLTTDISWLELSDLNHKLLRQMQLEAPGTFHHSLVVAALSEAAAEKIGANAPMCRVCAYFHDVGKLKKPGYFIENQYDGAENPHNALTPTMSALIIIAHVKDGVDLAVKHKLNPRIIDVIQEHHGDSLVAYFYRRAQEQKKLELEKVDRKLENPEDLPRIDEKNFRYPGPRPSTRESAIIALADTIESASRTLQKPTPARIQSLIDDLVYSRLHDGQLDDCPLTIHELVLIKESFATTLRSMLHNRISYPKDEERNPTTAKPSVSDREYEDPNRVIVMPKRA